MSEQERDPSSLPFLVGPTKFARIYYQLFSGAADGAALQTLGAAVQAYTSAKDGEERTQARRGVNEALAALYAAGGGRGTVEPNDDQLIALGKIFPPDERFQCILPTHLTGEVRASSEGATPEQLALVYQELFRNPTDTGPVQRFHSAANAYVGGKTVEARAQLKQRFDEQLSELYHRAGGTGSFALSEVQMEAFAGALHHEKIFAHITPFMVDVNYW